MPEAFLALRELFGHEQGSAIALKANIRATGTVDTFSIADRLELVLGLIDLGGPTVPRRHRYQEIVDRFEAVARTGFGRLNQVSDICRAVAVNQRTVAKAFHAIHGITPLRYIQELHLAEARKALLRANGSENVTRVAMRFGFHELGRLAADYRAAFGGSPSQTLRRPVACCINRLASRRLISVVALHNDRPADHKLTKLATWNSGRHVGSPMRASTCSAGAGELGHAPMLDQGAASVRTYVIKRKVPTNTTGCAGSGYLRWGR